MRPSNLCIPNLRLVACQKQNPLKIQNKEMLRDLVTDFIIRSFSNKNPSLSRKYKQPRYQPLSVKVEINSSIQHYDFTLPTLLSKYVQFEKASMENNQSIQPMILDILELVDKLQDNASTLCLELDGAVTPEIVLSTLIGKHIRDKKREILQGQYELAKSKIYTKYKKVSYVAIDSSGINRKHCQMLIDRISQDSSIFPNCFSQQMPNQQQLYRKHLPRPAVSKLKLLVDSCNIFDHPERLESLRRQKIISSFCRDEEEYQKIKSEARQKKRQFSNSGDIDSSTSSMLQDWIIQIQLSQFLFKRKYFPDKKKTINEEGSSSQGEEC